MLHRLIDPFQRPIDYLRLSVTDRCDFRCSYCLPEHHHDFAEPQAWLNFSEITQVVRAFAALGVRRVRLTGGEPLTRRNLPELATALAQLPGIEDLSLSTNASQLTRQAQALYQAGVRRLNVSLDSLQPERFKEMTRHGKLTSVLEGLRVAQRLGFTPIKINTVLLRGVNDAEVEDLVEFCAQHGFILRLIETMPLGSAGLAASQQYVDLQTIKARLATRYTLLPDFVPGGGPARYFRLAENGLKMGFITPISQHFCATCNRVRLSVEGTLYLCLGQNDKVELRPLLRAGISDLELQQVIISAVARKPERHEFQTKPEQVIRFMASTGG
jgi:cyclic pyranopterin phosphate synthase